VHLRQHLAIVGDGAGRHGCFAQPLQVGRAPGGVVDTRGGREVAGGTPVERSWAWLGVGMGWEERWRVGVAGLGEQEREQELPRTSWWDEAGGRERRPVERSWAVC